MSPPRIRTLLPALAFLCLVAARADAALMYTYTDLGNIAPRAINAEGMVAGEELVGGPKPGLVYSAYGPNAGHVALIPGLYDTQGLNSRGQVVGDSGINPRTASATWVETNGVVAGPGGTTPIGTFGGTYSVANGINDRGQVVGTAGAPGSVNRAFLDAGGKLTDLGTLGGTSSGAYAINAAGQVVGSAGLAPDPKSFFDESHAFLLSHGKMTDLGTLGGHTSVAIAINAIGQVAGTSVIAGGDGSLIVTRDDGFYTPSHAFLSSNGKMTDLGTLGGHYSAASAINDAGQVVGTSLISNNYPDSYLHAFLYSDGMMRDLNSLIPLPKGWYLSSASGINDLGQIIGLATDASGNGHGFLLTPTGLPAPTPPTVPEPSTLAIFGLAGLGLVVRLASRRRAV